MSQYSRPAELNPTSSSSTTERDQDAMNAFQSHCRLLHLANAAAAAAVSQSSAAAAAVSQSFGGKTTTSFPLNFRLKSESEISSPEISSAISETNSAQNA